MKLDKNVVIYSIVSIFIIVLGVAIESMLRDEDVINLWGILSIIIVLVSVFMWYMKYKTLNSLYLICFIFCYIFWTGQILLKVLGVEDYSKIAYETSKLINTVRYSVTSMVFMHIGAMSATKKSVNYGFKDFEKNINKRALKITGIILLFISAPFYFYNLYALVRTSLTYGYMALYGYDGESFNTSALGILGNLKLFFIPSLFMLLTVYKNKTIIRKMISIGIIVLAGILYLIGTRFSAVSLLIAYGWYYCTSIKKINGKNILVLLSILVVIAVTTNAIAVFRNRKEKSIQTLMESIEETKSENFVFSLVKEMGGSMKALYYTMSFVPSTQEYSYGYTYFASIMSIIPSQLMGGYSFANTADLPTWLMNKMQINYGPGFSIVAETYYNFGQIGSVMIFLIGIIFAKLYENRRYENDQILIRNTFIAIAFEFSISTIRNTTLLLFRNIFYYIIIPMVFISFIKMILSNGEKKHEKNNNFYTNL